MNVFPSISIDPDRGEPVVFADTVAERVRGPSPVAVDSVIQGAPLEADHVHPSIVTTLNSTEPPPAGTVTVEGSTAYVQLDGDWVTRIDSSPTLIRDCREMAVVFDAMVYAADPEPEPDVRISVTQLSLATAVHSQLCATVIATANAPPAAEAF